MILAVKADSYVCFLKIDKFSDKNVTGPYNPCDIKVFFFTELLWIHVQVVFLTRAVFDGTLKEKSILTELGS